MLKSPRIGEEPVDDRPVLSGEPDRRVRGDNKCRNRSMRAISEAVRAPVPPCAPDACDVPGARAIHRRQVVEPDENPAGVRAVQSVSFPSDDVCDAPVRLQVGGDGDGDRYRVDPEQGGEVDVRGVLPGGGPHDVRDLPQCGNPRPEGRVEVQRQGEDLAAVAAQERGVRQVLGGDRDGVLDPALSRVQDAVDVQCNDRAESLTPTHFALSAVSGTVSDTPSTVTTNAVSY